jgi:Ran GTPase-activating protein (RanGAP) involved in mRNA processing and transport
VEALEKNPTITYLDLSYNEISDDGLYYLIEFMEKNKNLKVVVLNGNINITTLYIDKLLDLVKSDEKL